MKNIQVIEGADNCVYDIFACSDRDFGLIFGAGEDIAFIDEVLARNKTRKVALKTSLARLWKHPVNKKRVRGIHGTLFYQLAHKRAFYPTLRDREAVNPSGTRLR